MKKAVFYISLLLITFVAGALRVKDISSIPPHLGNDEISIAYDSYSVRMTGKDEHGNAWPLSFQSHQTYKAPLYAYLNMPFNMWLGNTEEGVRMLSVVAGTLAVVFTGLIGWELGGASLGLIAAGLMALNPKSIVVSHIAFEANLAATMMLIGVWACFKYKKSLKNVWLITAGATLGLSIWGYHTQWGLATLLAIILPLLSRYKIDLKKWWLMWVIMIVVAAPIGINFIKTQTNAAESRANSQLWFKDPSLQIYWQTSADPLYKKVVTMAVQPVYNYVEHFGLSNNFSGGLGLFNSRQPLESGWFLVVTLPLVVLGLIKGKKHLGGDWKWLVGWWLVCPIVPALTLGGVTSVRNLAFIAPTIILTAIGMLELPKYWQKAGISVLILVNFFIFYQTFFVHYPKGMGDNFQYGYKQAWEMIKPIVDDYENIIVEPKFGPFGQFVGVPHLYFGYFGAFSPQEMLARVDGDGSHIGKYQFRTVDWNQEIYRPKSLYVVSVINPRAGLIYGHLKEINRVKNLDGTDQFIVYQTF